MPRAVEKMRGPTIEPAAPAAQLDERFEHLVNRIKELEERLARIEIEPELQATEKR